MVVNCQLSIVNCQFQGLALLQPLNSVLVLDDLDGIVLSLAAGYELEGSILAEVLELFHALLAFFLKHPSIYHLLGLSV